jgi:hypothetical protein
LIRSVRLFILGLKWPLQEYESLKWQSSSPLFCRRCSRPSAAAIILNKHTRLLKPLLLLFVDAKVNILLQELLVDFDRGGRAVPVPVKTKNYEQPEDHSATFGLSEEEL